MKKIIAKISKKTGAVSIETQGYQGADCLEATKKLEDGLGINPDGRELKGEFYEQSTTDNQQIGS